VEVDGIAPEKKAEGFSSVVKVCGFMAVIDSANAAEGVTVKRVSGALCLIKYVPLVE